MACGARSGLKPPYMLHNRLKFLGLNGLWSPFGIETRYFHSMQSEYSIGLNGLWSPFGIETAQYKAGEEFHLWAKWPVEPVRD